MNGACRMCERVESGDGRCGCFLSRLEVLAFVEGDRKKAHVERKDPAKYDKYIAGKLSRKVGGTASGRAENRWYDGYQYAMSAKSG